MRKPLSIYIHIPFCNKKCNYCAFYSISTTDQVKSEYKSALIKEIELRGRELSGRSEVETIYIGGGTPSVLPDGAVAEILDAVYKNFVVKNDAEITVEVNPTSITKQKAKEYAGAGVTRVSMGLQAKQDHHLKVLGRAHDVKDFRAAVELLREAGISNISGDIILGLPSQTAAEVAESVDALKDLNHISIYMLELEEDTPMKKLVDMGALVIPSDSQTVKLYNAAKSRLTELGFARYEISNFSKPGYESLHNQVYWARANYLGFGASAHSFVDGVRFANISNVGEYISHLLPSGEIPLDFKEALTEEENLEEEIMLGLRTTAGISLPKLASGYGERVKPIAQKIKDLAADGFLKIDADGNVSATDSGFMVLNKLINIILD